MKLILKKPLVFGTVAFLWLTLPGVICHARTITEELRRIFQCDDSPSIEVRGFNGDIRVDVGSDDEVRVRCIKMVRRLTGIGVERAFDAIEVEMVQDEKGIRIEATGPNSGRLAKCTSVRIDLEVPENSRFRGETKNGNILVEGLKNLTRVRTSNGKIEIDDASGEVEARTTNGPIEIEIEHGSIDAKTTNNGIDINAVDAEVVASTSNGRVEIDIDGGTVDARTSSGLINIEGDARIVEARASNGIIDIELGDTRSQVEARTSNGKIDFQGALTGDCRFQTSNGPITLELDESAPFKIEATTSNGMIMANTDRMQVERMDRKGLRATMGSNPGAFIEARTSNGFIKIDSF